MNLKRQKTSIKNRKYTGGKKDVTYFTKKEWRKACFGDDEA